MRTFSFLVWKLATDYERFCTERKLKTFWKLKSFSRFSLKFFLSRSRIDSRTCAWLQRKESSSASFEHVFVSPDAFFMPFHINNSERQLFMNSNRHGNDFWVFRFCSSNASAISVWRNELEIKNRSIDVDTFCQGVFLERI